MEPEMTVCEPETQIDSQSGSRVVVPSHGHGKIRTGGNPGNKGGPGAPRSSVRSLAREKSRRALNRLEAIVNGAKFLEDEDGKKIPVTPGHVISAAKVILELATGVDSIPEAMLEANVSLIARLHDLFPGAVSRQFTSEEMGEFGRMLEQELGQAKVVRT